MRNILPLFIKYCWFSPIWQRLHDCSGKLFGVKQWCRGLLQLLQYYNLIISVFTVFFHSFQTALSVNSFDSCSWGFGGRAAEQPVTTVSGCVTVLCDIVQQTKGMWTQDLRHKTQTTNLETQQPHLLFHMWIALKVQVYPWLESFSQHVWFTSIQQRLTFWKILTKGQYKMIQADKMTTGLIKSILSRDYCSSYENRSINKVWKNTANDVIRSILPRAWDFY